MNLKRILAVAVVAVMSVSAFAATSIAATNNETQTEASESTVQTKRHRPHGKREKVEAPENTIGKDAAKAAALKDAGLTTDQTGKVRSHVSESDDGTVIYKVHFSANEKWYSYKIDALTGEVIDHSEQTAEEHAAAKEKARAEREAEAGSSDSESATGRKHGKRAKPSDSDAAEGENASGKPAKPSKNKDNSTAEATDEANESANVQSAETI